MAHYPADTFQEATELAIEASNQLHGVINGDANAEVTVEDGSKIPSVRKAMVDSLYFKPPIAWAQGAYEDTYNQLREFVDGDVRTWWFAKGATVSTPVLMSTNPATDVNWTLWSAVTLNAATYETQKRLAAEAGFNMVGSFLLGATVTTTIDVVFYESDGKYYSWGGVLPKTVGAASTPATSGGIGAGAWVDRTDLTLRSVLSGTEGDTNVAHTQGSSPISRTVAQKVEAFTSLEDYGSSKTEFGMNQTTEATLLSDTINSDEDFLLPRNLSVAKELYGVRRNACAQSIRANSGNDGFNAQVTGVSSTQELANYGYVDNVSLIADITNKPYSAWEIVSVPTYSITGFSATGLDFTKMKKGMIVRTLHASQYFGIISSLSAETNTVNVIEWRKSGSTSAETPPNGYGLVINPVDKIWAANFNIDLPLGSRCENAAVAEYGIVNNNNPNPISMNMMDLVILGHSAYGATSAVFAHSSAAAKFYAPFIARNSTHAAFLADEDNYRGFWSVDSQHGFVYSSPDETKYSFMVKKTNAGNDDSLWMGVDSKGRVVRLPDKTRVVSESGVLDLFWRRVINGTHSAITSTLPSSGLQNGDVLVLHCTAPASGLWTISSGSILPPSGGGYVTSTTLLEGVYDAVYIGGTWYINK